MARKAKVVDPHAIPKPRKKRKPMTPEQKEAAAENLRLAREKRANANPPTYKNVDAGVLALPDNDPFSRVNVMTWIKAQKEELTIARGDLRKKVDGSESRVRNHQVYIRNLEAYLKNGDYIDMMMGAAGKQLVKLRSAVLAYDKDGNVKRSFGVFYPDDPDWTGVQKLDPNAPVRAKRTSRTAKAPRRKTKRK